MRHLIFSTIILLTFAACGQFTKGNKAEGETSSTSKDTITIYRNISLETCNCIFSTMKNNKPSVSTDSCYKAVLLKYNDSLKQLGFDPTTQLGQTKLSNEVVGKLYLNCPELFKLMKQEDEAEIKKKLFFKGELISQIELKSGLYKITMRDIKSKVIKVFFSKNPLDEAQIKKYESGYELTIEYEIIRNKTTNKEEYFLKNLGAVSSVGEVKVTTQ